MAGFKIQDDILMEYRGRCKKIVVPDGVVKIGSKAFAGNKNITSVKVPDTVTAIESGAFEGCSKLETVTGMNGVECIEDKAFSMCTALTELDLPERLKRIGRGTFNGCRGLAGEHGFFLKNKVAFAYFGSDSIVHVPEGTKVISQMVFANDWRGDTNPGNKNIHTVYLPEGLEEIGDYAFSGSNLSKVIIPESVRSIGDYAFSGSNLSKVIIPESVKNIGAYAFQGCGQLVSITIPETTEVLGDGIFAECRGLADEHGYVIFNQILCAFFGIEREIVLPEGITEVQSGVFNRMRIVSIKLPSTLKTLGRAFGGCDLLTEIVLPEGITRIEDATFKGCKQLKKIVLPTTLKYIGIEAFEGCEVLEEVLFPSGLKQLEQSAFSGCKGLKKAVLPEGLVLVGDSCFFKCSSLETIVLPQSMEKIGDRAFFGCVSLTSVNLGMNISQIGEEAFMGCEKLTSVNVEKDHVERVYSKGVFEGCLSLVDENRMLIVDGCLWKYEGEGGGVVIPEGVSVIAANAFREGMERKGKKILRYRREWSLTSVVLPSTLKKIERNAFSGCRGLKSLSLPEGLEVIEEEAFQGCIMLDPVQIPKTVKVLGERAFRDCNLKDHPEKMERFAVWKFPDETKADIKEDINPLENEKEEKISLEESGN